MQEVGFPKEGCHCDCSCYYIVRDECPEQFCFGGSSYITLKVAGVEAMLILTGKLER